MIQNLTARKMILGLHILSIAFSPSQYLYLLDLTREHFSNVCFSNSLTTQRGNCSFSIILPISAHRGTLRPWRRL